MLTATDKGPITSSPTKKGSAHTKSSKDETKPAINAKVAKDSTEDCPEDPVAGDAGLLVAQVLGHSKQKDSEMKIVHRKYCAEITKPQLQLILLPIVPQLSSQTKLYRKKY